MTIPTSVLSTADPDNSAAELVYTVISSLKGSVQMDNQTVSTFTQADLASGRVQFVHDGSEGAQAGFNFTVSDGITSLPAQPFDITVTPTSDPPAVTNLGASMPEVRALLACGCVCFACSGEFIQPWALQHGH